MAMTWIEGVMTLRRARLRGAEWERAQLVSTIAQLTAALADPHIIMMRAAIEGKLATTRHALDCLDTLDQTRIGA